MTSIAQSARRLALVTGAALLAAACAKKSAEITASIPADYRDRHPIIVAPAEESLDIFMRGSASAIDLRQRLELKAAADDFRANGQGRMAMLVPKGAYGEPHRGAAAVRAALASGGVSGVSQSFYRVEGPAREQPIRVVYTKLKARVATKCGQWPADIVGLQGTKSWNNEQYYNFGCAYQNALATQVADPLDLVRGRPEGRIDTERRVKVIEAQRNGEDASTQYRTTGTTINQAVGTK
ncbi:MAG: hypothetical protein BGP06_01075 [Rhizobiales bacterium 65-9]|nr:CpaD family pilus assembly protein [Hyphomicrobiales bacterium]OJY37342.1 MAG: hypothetical protein BGP06_01075 [Rhizobiales bacterium 65-9]